MAAALGALLAVASAKDKPQLTVEVLKAETVHRAEGTTKNRLQSR